MTWARDWKKRIVWRCVSQLEFGTKCCHVSPPLDESKLYSAILNAMNEYAAIRQEVPMMEEAKQALTEAGTKLLTLKRRLDEVSHEYCNLLDILLSYMADADLNARMKTLTDEKAFLKEQILEVQQEEVGLEEQFTKRQQIWDSLIECSEGYTAFDDKFRPTDHSEDHGRGCRNHLHPLPGFGDGTGTEIISRNGVGVSQYELTWQEFL